MARARWASSCVAVLFVVTAVHSAGQIRSEPIVFSGRVETGGQPVAGANVTIHGTELASVTANDGQFSLAVNGQTGSTFIIVAKPGYFNLRTRVKRGTDFLRVELRPLPSADNPDYAWQDPTPNPARKDNCGNCHSRIYEQWAGDAHSRAAVNPAVLAMYNGTDFSGHPNVSPGYRLDWSDEGTCVSCHAPMAAVEHVPNLNHVAGVAKTGVSCDFCHKVQDVAQTPQFASVTEMRLLRPSHDRKLIFGPLDDAMFPGDIPDLSYSPLFTSSRFCAGCHDGAFWGTPVYETYTEWRNSAYASAGIECQQCHMRATTGMTRIANERKGGIARSPDRIGSHQMMGAVATELLKSAVTMDTSAIVNGSSLHVTVTIANTGAGHHVPTGQPMRHMLLLVSAVDAVGRPLRLMSGNRVPGWGGDYSGRPGKGFAKILATVSEYPRALVADEFTTGTNFPAPFWRRNKIVSDNRIAARTQVTDPYTFDATDAALPVKVTATLVYRRAFQRVAQIKGWRFDDVELAVNHADVGLALRSVP
jgi:nitrate/TMAO reductase-like tetraheme cytochrome c subunit